MSTVYTPTPTALTSITLPSDGDAEDAASVDVALEALADGIKFISTPNYVENTYENGSISPDMISSSLSFADLSGLNAGPATLTIPSCVLGDVYQILISFGAGTNVTGSGSAPGAFLRIKQVQDVGGTNVTSFPTGMAVPVYDAVDVDNCAITALLTCTVAGTMKLVIQGQVASSGDVGVYNHLRFSAARIVRG